jgi:hypothetical protein
MTITTELTPPPVPSGAIRSMAKAVFNSYMEQLVTFYDTNNAEMTVLVSQFNDFITTLNGQVGNTTAAMTLVYTNLTADTNPGAGLVKLGSATQNTSTVIRVSLQDSAGKTWTNTIDSWDDSTSSSKGQLCMFSLADETKWINFSITSIASPSGYRNITVAPLSSSAANPFTNGEAVGLRFTAKGDKGDTGSGGVADVVWADRESNTILAAADKGKLIRYTSGTLTQTYNACSSLGASWWHYAWNDGAGTITLDPNGAETINGASTLVLGPGDAAIVFTNGTLLKALGMGYVGNHEVTVHSGNLFGSTNNKVRRFTTLMTSLGAAITYADSVANGASFTINQTGLYEIHYSEVDTGSFGISLNSAQLTTTISAISVANRLAVASNASNSVTRVVRLVAGDVIRAHCAGTQTDTSDRVFFSIRKIANAF